MSFIRLLGLLGLYLGAVAACAADEDGPPMSGSPVLLPVCVRVFQSQCGLLDRKGHWVVEPRYGEIYASDDLWIVVSTGGLSGVLDSNGHELIAPQFDAIGRFRDGVAPANTHHNDKYGFIDRQGHWALPQRFDSARMFWQGWAAVAQRVGDQERLGFIDRQGQAMPGVSYGDVGTFAYGFASVSEGSAEESRAGLIDTHGKLVLPLSQDRISVNAVMENRVVENGRKLYTLRDGQGHVLFSAYSIGEVDAERAFYSANGTDGVGLLDVRSGKPIVPASGHWLSSLGFSDGVAWVKVPGPDEKDYYILVDHQGRTILPRAAYAGVGQFSGGAAPIARTENAWQLIDHQGHAVTEPVIGAFFRSAWDSSIQTQRPGDVFTYQVNSDDGQSSKTWVDTHGHVLAKVEPYECGFGVVRDGAGKIIWPSDVEATCLVKKNESSGDWPASDPNVSPERVAKVLHGKAGDAIDRSNDLAVRDERGGPSNLIAASEHRVPLAFLRDAAWQKGPARVHLDGPASFDLPAGYRYLASKDIERLRGKPAVIESEDGKSSIPFALVAPDDGSWSARVVVVEQGHVSDEAFTPDADDIKRTMEIYSTNILGQLRNPRPTMHSISWLREPRWDAASHRLDWSYQDMAFGSMLDSQVYVSSIVLGRTFVVGMQMELGSLSDVKSMLYVAQPPLDAMAASVRFDPGQAYEDAKPGDPSSKLGLREYITGPPSKEMQELPARLEAAHERNFWHGMVRILPLIGLLIAALIRLGSRQRKRGPMP
ncbi:DUF2167 domain-containing protein [Dyella sp.]|uniref:DUF2167 domain-containing protein n=1 Tax=Dyella sp. TaxID=1869338 RepID=UPI002ED6A7EF